MPEHKWQGERWYAVHVANSGRVSLRWSAPFADGPAAKAAAVDKLDAGEATMAFVVWVRPDGGREIRGVYPQHVRKIIGHYTDLLAALKEGTP